MKKRTPDAALRTACGGLFILLFSSSVWAQAGASQRPAGTSEADLTVVLADSPDPVNAGANLTYTVTATNNGPDSADQVSISLPLPPGTSFVSADGGVGASCNAASPVVCSWTGPTANGASRVASVVAVVNAASTGNLTANATVSSNTVDPNMANDSASATTNIMLSADLAVSKSNGVTSSTPGTNTVYSIVASNAGPSDALGSMITDNFPAACASVSWTCAGAGGGTCSASGSGNITDPVDLPAGASVTYTATCAIDSAATGFLENTATITAAAGVVDPSAGNNSATDTDTLLAEHDLAISKDDGVSVAVPGTAVTWQIVASNPVGPSDAVGAAVSDTFAAICSSISWTCSGAGGGSCATAGAGNIAELVNLPLGGSVTFSATCVIDSAATGSLDNSATIAAATGTIDPNTANDAASDSDTLTPQADLVIGKTDNLATVPVGGTGTYVISVSNVGPSDAPGSAVTDAFPAAVTPGAWTCSGSGGGVCPAAGSGNIAATADLPAGASVTFSVPVSYANSIGVVSNTATVASSATVTDPNAANNSATDTTEIVSPATLSAIKIGIANMTVVGGSLNYVIEISNSGPQNQLDNPGPEMLDVLPFGYVYLSATASTGTLSYDQPTRTLEWSGPVAVGQVISISVNGTIDPAVAGNTISNQAELRFDADGNGSNEATALSDDPGQPGNADPTVVGIGELVPVPALDRMGLLLLALLLAAVGSVGVRRT